jgi:hypothetical protein
MKQIDDLDGLGAPSSRQLARFRPAQQPPHQRSHQRDVRDFVAYTKKPINKTSAGDLVDYQAYMRNKTGSAAIHGSDIRGEAIE